MAGKKLWGGRFAAEEDPVFAEFNRSLPFDRELLEDDVAGSIAYARALERAGVISGAERRRLAVALAGILATQRNDPGHINRSCAEDVHTYVEVALQERVGTLALKLHTGRSRNDQVATDLRLYLRRRGREVEAGIDRLLETIGHLAERHPEVILPGYTHLQGAQPVLLAHYFLAYGEMFLRDRERLRQACHRMNVCPLGAGALSGTIYRIDRRALARSLGFARPSANSMDSVSDRDFVLDFLSFAAILAMHVSRMAEDLILYSTSEFGFIEMDDSVASGSSLMPQKKNPDAPELLRAKTGRVCGHLAAMLMVLKGLPMTYNKDLQEDKEGLFDSVRTVLDCVRVLRLVLETMHVRGERMRERAESGFLNATELADYLVARKVPFREAHGLAGRAVRRALDLGLELRGLPLEEYRSISSLFRSDLYACLDLPAAVERRAEPGGTAPARVAGALRAFRRRVASKRGR